MFVLLEITMDSQPKLNAHKTFIVSWEWLMRVHFRLWVRLEIICLCKTLVPEVFKWYLLVVVYWRYAK